MCLFLFFCLVIIKMLFIHTWKIIPLFMVLLLLLFCYYFKSGRDIRLYFKYVLDMCKYNSVSFNVFFLFYTNRISSQFEQKIAINGITRINKSYHKKNCTQDCKYKISPNEFTLANNSFGINLCKYFHLHIDMKHTTSRNISSLIVSILTVVTIVIKYSFLRV